MLQERFKITPFSAVILRKGQKILLMKRCKTALSGGFYAFPGGGIDGVETIPDATIREAQEELGIKLEKKNLKFVHVLHVKTDAGQEYVNFFFEATEWEGDPKVMEPHKCDEIAWFDLNNLPQSTMPTHKYVIEMVHKNSAFGEYGWD